MFGLSFEHVIILGIVLLVMGPRKLPEMAQGLGKAMKNFKDAISGVEEATYRKIDANPSAEAPKTANPAEGQPEASPKKPDSGSSA